MLSLPVIRAGSGQGYVACLQSQFLTSSTPSLGIASLPACTAALCSFPCENTVASTHSTLGNPGCGRCKVLVAPHFLQVEQPHEHAQQSCMQVPQSFPGSTHTLGGSVPRQHTVAPHTLHTFSGQCSHTGRDRSVLLALHLPQVGETLVCTAQWVCEAVPCWVTLQVEGPLICTLWCPPVHAGRSSRRGD